MARAGERDGDTADEDYQTDEKGQGDDMSRGKKSSQWWNNRAQDTKKQTVPSAFHKYHNGQKYSWQAPAPFELPDDAKLELKRRFWNSTHPTPKAKPARKPTLFERIIARLARLVYRLALTLAYRYAPKPAAPPRTRKPAYVRRQALHHAASILASAAAARGGTANAGGAI